MAQSPCYTDVDVTDFAIRTYDYVEQGSFVPGDKRLAYYSTSHNTAGVWGYREYDKANRKYDSPAPHPGFDAHWGSSYSNTSTGGYSEVGYYPQWNNPSASAAAQQQAQAEQQAEGDPPLLHWDRTYFDSRPPEEGDEQLLVPDSPLPPVSGGVPARSLSDALDALETVADEEAVIKAFEDSIFDGARNFAEAIWEIFAVPADLTLGLMEAGMHVVGLGPYKPIPNLSASAGAVDGAYAEGVPYKALAGQGVVNVIKTVPTLGALPTIEGAIDYVETGDATQWRHAATNQLVIALGVRSALAAPRVTSGAKVALEERVNEVHGALDRIAQNQRTTAGLDTVEGTRVFGGGKRDLAPIQRSLLGPEERAARLPGAHAEITVLEEARAQGLTPSRLVSTRPFCPDCRSFINSRGGRLTGPNSAEWP